jgi:hypothetical protein
MILDPCSWIVDSAETSVLVVLVISTLTLGVVLALIDQTLKTEVAPFGIISFELAGSRAKDILISWSETARQQAFLSLGLDYLFLCVYPFALSLACHIGANTSSELRLSRVGIYLS